MCHFASSLLKRGRVNRRDERAENEIDDFKGKNNDSGETLELLTCHVLQLLQVLWQLPAPRMVPVSSD